MGTVDLRLLEGDQVVIHYGGSLKSVDAYTFANSLIAFADTIRHVSDVVDPGPRIEVRVEALGDGSFRAVIKRIPTNLSGLFKRAVESIIFAYIAYLLIERVHGPPDATQIQINTEEVIIVRGKDKIIVPRKVYEKVDDLKANPRVQEQITRTFEIIEDDEAVKNFGITPRITDTEPLVQVEREDFPRLSAPPPAAVLQENEDHPRRARLETTRLLITKAWLKGATKKWSFEWNGVPISAPIRDVDFLARLEQREYLIGYGDVLYVEIGFQQFYDEGAKMYVNDTSTYEIVRVIEVIQRTTTQRLFPD